MEEEQQQAWSIAIKAVGKGIEEENFTVTVNPEDDLESLHHKIEAKTVPTNQAYRNRARDFYGIETIYQAYSY